MRAAVEGIKPLNKYLERIKQLRIPTGEGTTMTKVQGSTLRPIQSHLRFNFTNLRLEKRE